MPAVSIRVETYSGYKGDQEPTWVWLESERIEVIDIGDRWYDPGGSYFRLRTRNGLRLLIKHDNEDDTWWLVDKERTDG